MGTTVTTFKKKEKEGNGRKWVFVVKLPADINIRQLYFQSEDLTGGLALGP